MSGAKGRKKRMGCSFSFLQGELGLDIDNPFEEEKQEEEELILGQPTGFTKVSGWDKDSDRRTGDRATIHEETGSLMDYSSNS